ncbi:hypothetical protein RJ55_02445 [Drechmeria coniospora]|nr:hypothetical protein RJ55_02445 [Drechmeria coniospora]
MHTPPEKRRGGSHAIRTGPAHVHRQSGSSHNAHGAGGNLPTPPPRAAVVNGNVVAGADGAHDGAGSGNGAGGGNGNGASGGPSMSDRRDKEKDKEKEKDKDGGGRASSGIGRTGSSAKGRSRFDALLREKNEQIALLEKDKNDMEREFQRALDQLSQSESETATFWQSKHSALNQQFLRTDTELRLLRAEVDLRDGERDELRRGWEVLRRELGERDEEIRSLRAQIRGLKDFVSTSTRAQGQTTDEVFGDGMTRLGNRLQNWVIVHFRKAKLADLSDVDDATLAELGELVPMYEELVDSAKVHLLQSIVSRILVDMVFDAYFVGLSEEQTRHVRQMEGLLSSFAVPDEAINQWRSSTLELLRHEAPEPLHAGTSKCVESVIARANRILDAITVASSADAPPTSSASKPRPGSDARDAALRVLVSNSVELARLLVVQRAVLRVHMPVVLPHQQVLFEPESMEDIGGEDEDALARREILCVVFPAVIKNGDENGGQMQFRNVIAKAKVLCSPGL